MCIIGFSVLIGTDMANKFSKLERACFWLTFVYSGCYFILFYSTIIIVNSLILLYHGFDVLSIFLFITRTELKSVCVRTYMLHMCVLLNNYFNNIIAYLLFYIIMKMKL